MRIRFGCFELDDERLLLTRDGRAIGLRPKVFDLLVVLVRERARVVRREELFERLWSSTAVGSGSLSGLVNELRSALGECGRGPSSIRTVHARGYQFVAAAVVLAAEGPVAAGPADSAEGTPAAGEAGGEVVSSAAPQGGDGPVRSLARLGFDPVVGARAFIACLPGEVDRSVWLAERASEALSAGYRLRYAAAGAATCDAASASASRPGEARGAPSGKTTEAVAAPLEGAPVALLLDVVDPGTWHRSGGLRRLLDLLGRTPVLVLAALAASPRDAVVETLLAADERIDWFDRAVADSDAASNPVSAVVSDRVRRADAARDEERVVFERTLQGLARAGGPSFEAALRSLGFEAARTAPIRTLRRVEPAAARSPVMDGDDALAGWGAEESFSGFGIESGSQARREPEVRRRGP